MPDDDIHLVTLLSVIVGVYYGLQQFIQHLAILLMTQHSEQDLNDKKGVPEQQLTKENKRKQKKTKVQKCMKCVRKNWGEKTKVC